MYKQYKNSKNAPPVAGLEVNGVSAQGFAVSHVLGAGPTQVRPLQQEIRQAVQAEAGSEGGDEAVQPTQEDAKRPAHHQQHYQPDDRPETGAAVCHPGGQQKRC